MKETLHIYLRVSSSSQEEDGYGLETQRKVGLELAQKNGFLSELHEEGAASSSLENLSNRPVMSALLSRIEKGEIRHLYAYAPDRLSRNEQTSGLIRYTLFKHNVRLYTQGGETDFGNSQDKLMFGILSQFASYENEVRTGRLRRGRLETVRVGNWHGGTTPFGYKVVQKKLVIDPDTSEWVRKVYQWYADGLSIDQIRIALIANNVRTSRGKINWSYNSIRILLDNQMYDGRRTYEDKVVGEIISVDCPRIVEPVVSKIVRDKIALVESNGKKNNKNNLKVETLLRDLMVCGNCGSSIGQRIVATQRTRHYTCKHNERKHRLLGGPVKCVALDGTRSRSANIDEADHLVWVSVVKTLSESSLYKEDFKRRKLGVENTSLKDEKVLRSRVRWLEKEISKIKTVIATQSILKKYGSSLDVVRSLNDAVLGHEAEHQELLVRLSRQKEEKKWIDWVGDFQTHITDMVSGRWSLEDKKTFLTGVIDEIVMTTVDKQEHRFDIKFNIAHDGSKIVYRKGAVKVYDVVGGEKVVTVNTVDGISALTKKKINA